MNKKYLNITEVAKITGLKEYIIRYWDSIDPKTNELRISGISTKSRKGTRYFNKDNINRLINLKNLIYENGDYNPSLKLAEKIINSKDKSYKKSENSEIINDYDSSETYEKIDQILQKMRILLK